MKRLFSTHPLVASAQSGKSRPALFMAIVQMLAILVFAELLGFVILHLLMFLCPHLPNILLESLKDLYIPFGSVIFSVYLWVNFIEKRPFSSLGLFGTKHLMGFSSPLKIYSLGLIVAILTMKIYLLIGLLTGIYAIDDTTLRLPTSTQTAAILLIFFGWVIQGAAEEILIRGFLFQACTKKSILTAALVSSAVFSMLHLGNAHITPLALINLFLYGILALCIALYTESLWASFAYHSAWNFSQGNLFGISVSGNTALGVSVFHFQAQNVPVWLSGGLFGAEGSIIITALLIISIGILLKGIGTRYDLRVLHLN